MTPLSSLLGWIVDASWQMSLLIVLLWGGRSALRRFAGSGVVTCLWLLVAARLLLPWPVAARWGLPLPSFTTITATPDATPPQAWTVRAKVRSVAEGRAGKAVSDSLDTTVRAGRDSALDLWGALYLIGAFLALARLVRSAWITRRWVVRSASADEEARLAQVFAEIAPALRRGVIVRLTDALEVPALAGMFRPCIWMPRVWFDRLDRAELRHVLLHELGHARRHDLLAQWLCALACCVHWFNPLVWLLSRAARTDRELACDAWVLAREKAGEAGDADEGFGVAYGRTLIRVAARVAGGSDVHQSSFGIVTMAVGKRQLSLRVREIGGFRPRTPWRGIAAGGLAASLGVAVITLGRAAPPPVKAASPAKEISAATPTPTPADPGGSGRWGVEVEAKFVEFSGEALHSLQEQRVKTRGRVKELLDRIAAVSAGKDVGKGAPPASFAITQLLPKGDFDGLIRTLNQLKGVDLLSAPRVTTKSGQKATVEIIREVMYPTAFDRTPGADGKVVPTPKKFDKKNTGVTLAVEPDIAPARDVVDLNVSWQLVDLEGWVRMSDGQPVAPAEHEKGATQPVFATQTIDTFVSVPTNSVLVLGSLRQAPGTWYNDFSHAPEPAGTEALVLTFISLKLVELSGSTPPGPRSTASPFPPAPPGNTNIPYGVPVPGKPGYVTSPYAKDAGYIDVHGFPPGSQVRDPYTQKLFLVP